MALSHDGFTFADLTHHGDLISAPSETPVKTGQFFGVKGEGQIVGERYGRDMVCRVHLKGYANAAALKTAIQSIRDKQGKLTGTLTVTGNLAQTIASVTFLEIQEPEPGAMRDASGVNGWHQQCVLKWRQRI